MSRNSWPTRAFRYVADSARNRVLALLVGAGSLVVGVLALLPKPAAEVAAPGGVASGPLASGPTLAPAAPIVQINTAPGGVNAAGGQVNVNTGAAAGAHGPTSGPAR